MNNIYKKMGLTLVCLACGFSLMAQETSDVSKDDALLLPAALEQQADFKVFTKLLKETQWDQALMAAEDEDFVMEYNPPQNPTMGSSVTPESRPYAFTVFAEHDSVFASRGIQDAATLTAYLQEHYADNSVFEGMLYNDQYTDARHVVNRFVAYHLLPQILRPEQLVIHYNESDFDLDAFLETGIAHSTIPVYEYYTTMGEDRRLLKLYESTSSGGVRLNRIVEHNPQTFMEQEVKIEGILVSGEHMQKASNGNIYFLNKMLVYDDDFALNGLAKERLRFDFTALTPELMNLGYRRLMNNSFRTLYLPMDYMDNIKVLSGKLFYNPGFRGGWSDYQGDELSLHAQKDGSDVLIKLPPVSADGMYQVRMGFFSNPLRGIVQYYFGTEDNIAAIGIPIDERVDFNTGYIPFGWSDSFVDSDLILYQANLMKAPNGIQNFMGGGESLRDSKTSIRRIIGVFDMRAGETYYLRIKTSSGMNSEVLLDYLELVPSTVYDNPEVSENIW